MKWLSGEAAAALQPSGYKGIGVDSEGLWFWDETDTAAFGPYSPVKACLRGLLEYVNSL